MQDFDIKGQWKELKDTLRPMTPKKKLEHLWEYYKWVLVVLIVVAVLIYIAVVGYSNAKIESLLYGEAVNLSFDAAGVDYLSSDLLEHLGGVKGKQKVGFYMSNLVVGDDSSYENYMVPLMRTSSEIQAGSLDYLLADSKALQIYLQDEMLLDLRLIFTAEELAEMEENLVYGFYEETGESIPLAINVTDSSFMTHRLTHKKPTYLAFTANTKRYETCKIFYNYFMAYQPE